MFPIFLIFFLCGLVFTIAGFLLKKKPPKHRNHFYGYRTSTSKKSQAHWDLAQTTSGAILLNQGLSLIATGLLALLVHSFLPVSETIGFGISLLVLFGLLIYLVVQTEMALSKL